MLPVFGAPSVQHISHNSQHLSIIRLCNAIMTNHRLWIWRRGWCLVSGLGFEGGQSSCSKYMFSLCHVHLHPGLPRPSLGVWGIGKDNRSTHLTLSSGERGTGAANRSGANLISKEMKLETLVPDKNSPNTGLYSKSNP